MRPLLAILCLLTLITGCTSMPQSPALPARMRGVNVNGGRITPAAVETLASWHINALRINFGIDKSDRDLPPPTADDPLAPYQGGLAKLDAILPVCAEHHIGVILCVSGVYGRRLDVFWKQVDGQAVRDHLPLLWRALAERYRDNPTIIAYDIFNEPNYKEGEEASWQDDILPRSIAAIRAVDPDRWLVVEPGPWGLPAGFATMKPVDDPRVIYSFHHYAPHNYTHQGVGKQRQATRGKLVYPGMLRMFDSQPLIEWDRHQLEVSMQPAIDFADKYHVRMLVGEFGVIRWAPGRDQWLRDSIAVFEKHHFDWLFHSYSGWNGWNPTFGPDDPENNDPDGGKDTKRLEVLKQAWSRNLE